MKLNTKTKTFLMYFLSLQFHISVGSYFHFQTQNKTLLMYLKKNIKMIFVF